MTTKKTFDFESAMIDLEKIFERLEGENESLEKSLELFGYFKERAINARSRFSHYPGNL